MLGVQSLNRQMRCYQTLQPATTLARMYTSVHASTIAVQSIVHFSRRASIRYILCVPHHCTEVAQTATNVVVSARKCIQSCHHHHKATLSPFTAYLDVLVAYIVVFCDVLSLCNGQFDGITAPTTDLACAITDDGCERHLTRTLPVGVNHLLQFHIITSHYASSMSMLVFALHDEHMPMSISPSNRVYVQPQSSHVDVECPSHINVPPPSVPCVCGHRSSASRCHMGWCSVTCSRCRSFVCS